MGKVQQEDDTYGPLAPGGVDRRPAERHASLSEICASFRVFPGPQGWGHPLGEPGEMQEGRQWLGGRPMPALTP